MPDLTVKLAELERIEFDQMLCAHLYPRPNRALGPDQQGAHLFANGCRRSGPIHSGHIHRDQQPLEGDRRQVAEGVEELSAIHGGKENLIAMILPEKLPVVPMKIPEPVYLSQLEEVEILWPGDVRMLAEFVLRAHDARDQQASLHNSGTRTRSRTTLHGLAGQFAQLTWLPKERIETIFLAHGFNLGAVVEFD